MPDYTPPLAAQGTITLTADELLNAGDPVQVAGPGRVGHVTGATPMAYVGVVASGALAGEAVTIHVNGAVHEGVASPGVTAGDLLMAAAAAGAMVRPVVGRTTPDIDITVTRAIIGLALTTAPAGQVCKWLAFR